MEMNPAWSILSYVLMLVLITVAAVDVLQDAPYPETEYVKWVFPILAIMSIIFLKHFVINLKRGAIQLAYVCIASGRDGSGGQKLIVRNVPAYLRTAGTFGSCPSGLFVTTFLIFALPNCLAIILDIVCRIIDLTSRCDGNEPIYGIVNQTLLLIFTALQTQFLLVNFRLSIQRWLQWTWILLSVVMATNVAVWIFIVGQEIKDAAHSSKCSYCDGKSIYQFVELLYPFQIEYCVMSSLLAFAILKNTGRFAEFLRRNHDPTLTKAKYCEKLAKLLSRESHVHGEINASPPEFEVLLKHPTFFFGGLLFVLVSIVVATFVRSGGDSVWKNILLRSTELLMSSFGLASILLLLCYLKPNKGAPDNRAHHRTDRTLLWLGVAAILLNSINSIWSIFSAEIATETITTPMTSSATSTTEPTSKAPVGKLTTESDPANVVDNIIVATRFVNIFQSVLQAFALEYLMICQFTRTNRLVSYLKRKLTRQSVDQYSLLHIQGRSFESRRRQSGSSQVTQSNDDSWKLPMFNFLIMLNASEWILSAICFSSFIPHGADSKEATNVLPLLLMPLQVFFRFHSAACIHDFKDFVRVEGVESGDRQEMAVSHGNRTVSSEEGSRLDLLGQLDGATPRSTELDFKFSELYPQDGRT